VDGFDQDERASERSEGGEVLCGFLAAQGDPFEAFDLADAVFDAGAAFVEYAGKECRFCGGILTVRNGGAVAAPARCVAVGLGIVTFVAEHGSRRDIGSDVEQDFKIAAVAGLAPGEMEGQRQAVEIDFQVDFG